MPKGILAIGVVIHKAGLHLDTSRCERARGRRDRSTVLAKLRLNHTIATEVPTQPNPKGRRVREKGDGRVGKKKNSTR